MKYTEKFFKNLFVIEQQSSDDLLLIKSFYKLLEEEKQKNDYYQYVKTLVKANIVCASTVDSTMRVVSKLYDNSKIYDKWLKIAFMLYISEIIIKTPQNNQLHKKELMVKLPEFIGERIQNDYQITDYEWTTFLIAQKMKDMTVSDAVASITDILLIACASFVVLKVILK